MKAADTQRSIPDGGLLVEALPMNPPPQLVESAGAGRERESGRYGTRVLDSLPSHIEEKLQWPLYQAAPMTVLELASRWAGRP